MVRLKTSSIMAGVTLLLLSCLWFFALTAISGPLSTYSVSLFSLFMGLSIVCCVALWRFLKDRQTMLLAISLAGMASFLAAYLAMILSLGMYV